MLRGIHALVAEPLDERGELAVRVVDVAPAEPGDP